MRLHKCLKFRNEDEVDLNEDGSLFKKDLGNATVNTEISFEYEVKKRKELKKANINI